MTLLAGYDFALELAQPLVRDLVLRNLQLDGQPLRPPAEFSRPFTITVGGNQVSIPVSGIFHCVIDGADVDIGNPAGDEVLVITATFSEGSIRASSVSVCPLGGTVTFDVPLAIEAGPTGRVVADLPNAKTSVEFDQQSTEVLDATPENLGVTADGVSTRMVAEFKTLLKSTGKLPVGDQTFELTPGVNGSIDPPLAFTEAALACLHSSDRAQQALVLLGTLLAANTGQGNPANKTRRIPAGRNMALSISPAAFRALLFCPGIARALGLPPGVAAPGACGGPPVNVGGVTITGVTDRFVAGAVAVDVTFTTSGFCYTADGSVTITLTPMVSSGALSFGASAGQPNVTVSIPWYCYIGAVFINPTVAIILGVFDIAADGIASQEAGSRLGSLLGQLSLSGGSAPFYVEEASINVEGLTIASTETVLFPPAEIHFAWLRATRELVRSEQLAHGEFDLSGPCGDLSHSWSEERRWSRQTVIVETALYGYPITATWELLGSGGAPVPLNGNSSGTVQVPVTATYQTASGTTSVQQTARIGWHFGLGQTSLILTNDPVDGNYAVELTARVSNCAGTLQRTFVRRLSFDGHVVEEITSGLNALQECLPKWADRFELPPDILREVWLTPMDAPLAGRVLMELAALDDPAVYELAQSISLLLASELRDPALRPPPARELGG